MKRVAVVENFFEGAVSFEKGQGWIKPWRLPFDKLSLFPSQEDGIVPKAEMPAGVRMRFKTDSSRIVLAFLPSRADQADQDPKTFDLCVNGRLKQGVTVALDDETASFDDLGGDEKAVELWLPQFCPTALRQVLIDDDAELEAIEDHRPKWITYGSSITHCRTAHSPARTWPGIVARKHDLNLTCLGYGGNCLLNPMVARMIRDLPAADFISLKVGINIHGTGSLSPRTFKPNLIGFIEIVREKHPEAPMAVISPIISPLRETIPSTAGMTLRFMREEVEDAVNRLADCGDGNLYYFDGLQLFGRDLVEKYLPDEVHPDGGGYEILAANFSRLVLGGISL